MKRAILVTALACAGCATRIPAGHVGLFVYASSGVSSQVLTDGLYWHMPWTHLIIFPAQWNEYEETIHVLTNDDVHLDVRVGMALRPNVKELFALQQDYGTQFYDTFAQSAFFTATRTVLAGYNMVDIPENSEKIENEIRAHVAERIKGNHLELGRIALQHIDYPEAVQTAIEERLVVQQKQVEKEAEIKIASQDADIAKIKAQSDAETEQIKANADAEVTRIQSEAEAKAQALLGKTLTPLLVELRALTNPSSKLVFVPEGKQLSVVLGEASAAAAGAATMTTP
jgi:regulator of protease activity HflC (stomatin/prohibitin superfamily)